MPGARKKTTSVSIENPMYEARVASLGDYSVAFELIRFAGDASPIFEGLPGDACPCPHWGIVVRGSMTMRYPDHDETFEAGDTFYTPAGHVPIGGAPNTELITFSPSAELERVNAHIARKQAELVATMAGVLPERA